MKKLVINCVMVLLAGCTSKTEFGDCIGIADDRKPNLEYKLSVWNTMLAIAFFGTVFPPVVVLANETFCPVGTK